MKARRINDKQAPKMEKSTCLCGSGKSYADCCRPLHHGELPASALELMRSRYTAYALGLADYIVASTHPDHPDAAKNKDEWKGTITEFSNNFTFDKLDILDFQEYGNKATVTFTAHLTTRGQPAGFTEKSFFERIKGRWLYKSGEIF